jgi:signal transduction histidine kinase
MADSTTFARLVSLACHDLRTPLATVYGFARTIPRLAPVQDPVARYLGMIESASAEMTQLLEALALLARIEAGRFEPVREEVNTLELARRAAARLAEGRASADGKGTMVESDGEAGEQALAALADCALRHGGIDRIDLTAADAEVRIHPITPGAEAVVTAEELRDFGAAFAGRLVEALGGTVSLHAGTLSVTFGS